MIYELSFRGSGGSVVPGRLVPVDNSPVPPPDLALVGCTQVTFIVHGFNVEEQSGRESLTKLARELDAIEPASAIVFVLWPGDSPVGPLSYSFTEGKQANDTGLELARFIEAQVGNTVPLNFVAHSLGCRVTMETLTRLNKMSDGDRDEYPVGQVCLLAAAIDDCSLSLPNKYKQAAERAQRILVLSSVEDKVLKFIYPLGDLLQSFIYLFRETAGLALGYRGPRAYKSRRKIAGKSVIKKIHHAVPGSVISIAINKDDKVDHGDYLPPSGNAQSNGKQKAAAKLAINALTGGTELIYKI